MLFEYIQQISQDLERPIDKLLKKQTCSLLLKLNVILIF